MPEAEDVSPDQWPAEDKHIKLSKRAAAFLHVLMAILAQAGVTLTFLQQKCAPS